MNNGNKTTLWVVSIIAFVLLSILSIVVSAYFKNLSEFLLCIIALYIILIILLISNSDGVYIKTFNSISDARDWCENNMDNEFPMLIKISGVNKIYSVDLNDNGEVIFKIEGIL